MNKGIVCTLVLLATAICAVAAPRKAVMLVPEQYDSKLGVCYYCDEHSMEAYIQEIYSEVGHYYNQSNFFVASQFVLPAGGSISIDGSSTGGENLVFLVTAIDRQALYRASCQQITFQSPCYLREIREEGMAEMTHLTGTLELPSSLRIIMEKGLFSGDEGGRMPLRKLVLPESLDSLGLSSVVLNQLDTLEFKSMTPPRMAVQKDGTSYTGLPWIISEESEYNTRRNIVVIVPEGAMDAYRNAVGLGDYFTCFSGTPTQVVGADKTHHGKAYKVMRDGQMYIIRDGVMYDALGGVVK